MQLELTFRTQQPHASFDDAAALMNLLRGRGWMKARDIRGEMPHWSERQIRAIASESQGRILSGQQGYKLTLECTPEEERHAREWLLSQAKQMQQRALDISKVFHSHA